MALVAIDQVLATTVHTGVRATVIDVGLTVLARVTRLAEAMVVGQAPLARGSVLARIVVTQVFLRFAAVPFIASRTLAVKPEIAEWRILFVESNKSEYISCKHKIL